MKNILKVAQIFNLFFEWRAQLAEFFPSAPTFAVFFLLFHAELTNKQNLFI